MLPHCPVLPLIEAHRYHHMVGKVLVLPRRPLLPPRGMPKPPGRSPPKLPMPPAEPNEGWPSSGAGSRSKSPPAGPGTRRWALSTASVSISCPLATANARRGGTVCGLSTCDKVWPNTWPRNGHKRARRHWVSHGRPQWTDEGLLVAPLCLLTL